MLIASRNVLARPAHLNLARFTTGGKRRHPPSNFVVKYYEDKLEANFPRAYRLHRVIYDGTHDCVYEGKTLARVLRQVRKGKSLQDLERDELEILIQAPKQMLKIILFKVIRSIIVVLPFMAFPIGAMLLFAPRVLLSRHFWNPNERAKYWSTVLKQRRYGHYVEVIEHTKQAMQRAGLDIQILIKLPHDLEAIGTVKSLFASPCLQLGSLPAVHKYHLCRSHAVLPLPGTIKRLERRARVLCEHDDRLRSVGLETLALTELHYYCFMRQLDFEYLSRKEIEELLAKWLSFTMKAGPDASASFLLHAPILLQVCSGEYMIRGGSGM